MSKLILYNAIDEQIKAEVSSVKIVQLWNSQLDNEKEEEARTYPICYIEFSDIVWRELTKGCAEGDVTITIRTVIERLQTDDRTYLTLVDEVYKALQLFQSDIFTPLKRVTERQDTDHDNCIVWETDYITKLIDTTADSNAGLPEVTIGTLEVTPDLDIDNDVIRTGDGDFT